ncbi:MAG: type II secretion system F family protein [Phycisphaerales bacterium]|nr:type II secretion system F family protein [Phycisphaerales bacterium]
MSLWRYKAVTASGLPRRGELAADSAVSARASLRRIGLTVLDVRPVAGEGVRVPEPVSSSVYGVLRGRRRDAKAELLDALATLLASGVPLAEGLATLAGARAKRSGVRRMMLQVEDAVRSGTPLADAFEAQPGWYDAAEVAVVRAGQARGELAQALRSLADRHTRTGELAGKLASALAYPAIVAVAGVAVVIFLSLGPLPRLVGILEQAGVEPPALTAAVIGSGEALAQWWAILVAALISVALLASSAVRSISTSERGWPDAARRLVPQAIRGMALARLASELQSMTRLGVPLTDALRAAAQTFHGPVAMSLRTNLEHAATRVEAGERLSRALDDPQWFADDLRRLIEAGETAGELPDLLERLADRLERRATRLTHRLAGLIEPAAIIMLAVMIGIVVLSAVLPLLKLREVL